MVELGLKEREGLAELATDDILVDRHLTENVEESGYLLQVQLHTVL